jgi:hypothetical protein
MKTSDDTRTASAITYRGITSHRGVNNFSASVASVLNVRGIADLSRVRCVDVISGNGRREFEGENLRAGIIKVAPR